MILLVSFTISLASRSFRKPCPMDCQPIRLGKTRDRECGGCAQSLQLPEALGGPPARFGRATPVLQGGLLPARCLLPAFVDHAVARSFNPRKAPVARRPARRLRRSGRNSRRW